MGQANINFNFKKGFDYTGVAVVYFCHDGEGNVIFAKRNNNTRDEHGCWDIGGGGVEFGDSVEYTLRQEIKEEYGTDVLGFDPIKVKNGEPHKFDAVDWFRLDSLPEKLHSQFPDFFELYKERLL